MNALKYRTPAHSSASTSSAHTYANVLMVTLRLLIIAPARDEMVCGRVLLTFCI